MTNTDARYEIIFAIRTHPEIGRNSCSVIDECYGDEELIAMFGYTDSGAHRTPKGAVRKALAAHRLDVEMYNEMRRSAF